MPGRRPLLLVVIALVVAAAVAVATVAQPGRPRDAPSRSPAVVLGTWSEARDVRSVGEEPRDVASLEAWGGRVVASLLPPVAGTGEIRCSVGESFRGLPDGKVSVADGTEFTALLVGDELMARVPPGDGAGRFEFHELIGGRVSWRGLIEGETVACTVDAIDRWATGVHGTLVGEPLAESWVRGCGGSARIEDDGFYLSAMAPAECEIEVVNVTETHTAVGPSVHVVLVPGQDAEVEVRYPTPADYRPLTEEELAGRREIERRIEEIRSSR